MRQSSGKERERERKGGDTPRRLLVLMGPADE